MLSINLERLQREMDQLSRIGRTNGVPGVNRPGYSEADMAARRHMAGRMEAAGLQVRVDAAGNLSGLWDVGSGPVVMAGSHLDSVPMGGMFDGALGVCAALECVRTLMEAGVAPDRPIEVIATAEEEGRFGGMLGAQALSGQVDMDWLHRARDGSGLLLVDALRTAGLAPDDIATAARDPGKVAAFLELHIEQGPVLERAGLPVGVVQAISGVFNWTVILTGEANHAGTTPMDLRRDAFVGLVDFAKEIPSIIARAGTDQTRITIGAVEVKPGYPHTIPGEATFSLIGRDADPAVMRALANACRSCLERAAAASNLALDITEESWLDPKSCHPDIITAFRRQAEKLGLPSMTMPSGAGHDTQFMADLTRAGMIFVPSIGGISHAPEERTDWRDIEAGTNLLLHTIMDLAGAGPAG